MEKLGRYTLVRPLARGGMAEVFLASQTGPAGFERPCVIKRMLPSLSADPSFVKMFLAEAQLAAQLTHPNIAQIQDFGEEHGTYFIVMEYVSGTELRAVVKDLASRGRTLPLGTSAAIAAQVARALDYAYTAPGRDGRPLGVIHRDVSPHNILIASGGQAKLIDFGVARMVAAVSETADGVVKGKLAYMAPEQAKGRTDHCTDIYALGLVLHEMLTGQRALRGDSEMGVLMAVIGGHVTPLRSVRQDLPERLVAVVERALQVEPTARYPAASQMADELERLVPQLGGADWSYADARNRTLIVPMPKAPQDAGDTDDRARKTVRVEEQAAKVATPPPPPREPVLATPAKVAAPPLPPTVRTAPVKVGAPRGAVALIAVLLAGGPPLAVLALRLSQPSPSTRPADAVFFDGTVPIPVVRPVAAPAAKPGTLAVSSTLAAEVKVDGEPKGRAPLELELPAGEHRLELVAGKEGVRHEASVTVEPGARAKLDWAPGRGTLKVRAFPYAEVFVDGRRVGVTPFEPVALYEGRHTVRLFNKDTGQERVEEVTVTAGQAADVRADLSK